MESPSRKPLLFPAEEIEEMAVISPESKSPRFQALTKKLVDWINHELHGSRIIVQNLETDLYDGQVLQKLLEKLMEKKLEIPEVTQSEHGQKQKLNIILQEANVALGYDRWYSEKWSVKKIHSKNLISIIHLLVALVSHFHPQIQLPENVTVNVVIPKRKSDGTLGHRIVSEELTGSHEADVFDTIFSQPDNLLMVKNSIITFVNKHLDKLHFEVKDVDTQFHDGVFFIVLIGLLEGFFVPLYDYYVTPRNNEEKLHNVTFFFELLVDAGFAKVKGHPEDIVNKDSKSTLRILYEIFMKYRNKNVLEQ